VQQQIPRPQLTLEQYHDLVMFQTFTLMNTQLALEQREREVTALAQQLAEQTARADKAEAQLP
jgi:hypothetical protein